MRRYLPLFVISLSAMLVLTGELEARDGRGGGGRSGGEGRGGHGGRGGGEFRGSGEGRGGREMQRMEMPRAQMSHMDMPRAQMSHVDLPSAAAHRVDLPSAAAHRVDLPSAAMSMNRSPSMSRAAAWSGRSTGIQESFSGGSFAQRGSMTSGAFLRQGGAGQIPANRTQIQQFFKEHPQGSIQQFAGKSSNLEGNLSRNLSMRAQGGETFRKPASFPQGVQGLGEKMRKAGEAGNRFGEQHQQRNMNDIGNKIRDNINKDRRDHRNWFNDQFWDNHHDHPPYWRRNQNWWVWPTAAGIGAFLGWSAAPYYYGYEPGYYGSDYGADYYDLGPNYYSSSTTYVTTLPPTNYEQQSQAIQLAGGEPGSGNWMPLGVFTMTLSGSAEATPNLFLQLALNQDGSIAGTSYNSITDQTYPLEGFVDEKSQRVAWKLTDTDNSPILVIGVPSLAYGEAPFQIYYADGKVVEGLLVRLKDPNS